MPPRPPVPKPGVPAPAVEDMFGETDKGFAPPRLPQQPGQPASPFRPAAPVQDYSGDVFGGRQIGWKRFLPLIVAAVIVVAAIAVFAVLLSRPAKLPNIPTNTNAPANTNANANANQNIPPANVDVPAVEPPTTTMPEAPVDSDGDGLTDDEEKDLGTSSNKADTDADGLTDRAEIQAYKTDPLNPDTDGDGYPDGEEVINGFDPALPGDARLFNFPEE